MDEWNMNIDDYTTLLEPERTSATKVAVDVEVLPVESDITPLLTSDDDDLRAAARLLDQAADRRLQDKQLIADLQSRLDDLMIRLKETEQSADHQYAQHDRQIAQLETENKRLNEQIKVEISRGFLRKSMDNLRSVLE